MNIFLKSTGLLLKRIIINVPHILSRRVMAHIFMISCIIGTTVGSAMIYLPSGWIVGGVGSGIYGYLLGSE